MRIFIVVNFCILYRTIIKMAEFIVVENFEMCCVMFLFSLEKDVILYIVKRRCKLF